MFSSLPDFALVASERSGTTLLRLMLNGHSRLSWAPEVEFLWEGLGEDWASISPKRYLKELEKTRIFKDFNLRAATSSAMPSVLTELLAQIRESHPKEIFGVTLHSSYRLFRELCPKARFIHLLRDPRDVARSCVQMGWAGNTWFGADRWLQAEKEWDDLRKQLKKDEYLEIRYEELVGNPVETLKKVAAFVGVSYEDAFLSYPERSRYAAPKASLAFAWKERMPARDRRWVEARCKDLMRLRGYETHGPSEPPAPWDLAWLRVENRLRRLKFRVKRLGFPLWIADFLDRRFLFSTLSRWTRPLLHDRERRFLD